MVAAPRRPLYATRPSYMGVLPEWRTPRTERRVAETGRVKDMTCQYCAIDRCCFGRRHSTGPPAVSLLPVSQDNPRHHRLLTDQGWLLRPLFARGDGCSPWPTGWKSVIDPRGTEIMIRTERPQRPVERRLPSSSSPPTVDGIVRECTPRTTERAQPVRA